MSLTQIKLAGGYVNNSGAASDGWVSFTPTAKLIDGTDNLMLINSTVVATLDVFGRLSYQGNAWVPLYATDDTTTTPPGQGYFVHEDIDGAENEYIVIIPSGGGAGSTVDLSDLTPITNVSAAVYNYTVAFDAFFETAVRANRPDQLATAAALMNWGGQRQSNAGAGHFGTDLAIMNQSNSWIFDVSAWTQVSGSSFSSAAGVFGQAGYPAGTKVKWTEGGGATTKYGVVATVTSANPCLVTLIPTSDYTMGTIDANSQQFSYGNPPDFPAQFTWTPTWTGFSANPSVPSCFWAVEGPGGLVTLSYVTLGGTGTSNSTAFTIGAPVAANLLVPGTIAGKDAGTYFGGGFLTIQGATSTITLYKSGSPTGWTASGIKDAVFQVAYPIHPNH